VAAATDAPERGQQKRWPTRCSRLTSALSAFVRGFMSLC